ncbi:Staphyloferrin B transporter [Sutcliffiella rhizosphaerae]|uniref:Staphyloferrin B transporter n=1 Tax=Sutcliffiella rhizosphaerae TaxID=2880967 RepID=A0ABM8YLY9_9BACI|nr:Staphyloferrin B transporter [Sutcliffiella rhizosphaerae]
MFIMWIANFFVAASATMILPFLSLFIETFGNYSDSYVQRWSGFIFGITFLTAFFVSPIWGRIGDKYGYKLILLLTGSGIATSILLMSVVGSVHELFILRLLMGLATGFIPTSMALISSQTPKEIAGKTLGTLQTGTVSGGLLGPLIGGMLADSFGFAYTFFLTAALIYGAVILVAFGIKENKEKILTKKEKQYTRKEVLQTIMKKPLLLKIMILSTLIQAGNFSIQPLLALYVTDLTSGASNIALLAGFAFSATGFGNLLASRNWGKLGDNIGHEKVIVILMLASSLLFIPQALATSLWQLVLFRFLFGMVVGGLIPCMTAYIRYVAPLAMQGEVLGYNVSFRFLGNVIGPAMGGIIAGFYGISTVFYITSFIFLISGIMLLYSILHTESAKKTVQS